MGTVVLLGQGISYSASPAMHNAAFNALDLPHDYRIADIPPSQLQAVVDQIRDGDLLGANVTVPFKASVCDLLDEVESTAASAGAVNTVSVRGGRLVGSNTDVPAIEDQIVRMRPMPRRAAILGAGGAARAAALALRSVGCESVVHVARTPIDGAVSWDDLADALAGADLLINATPVGTLRDESPVPAGLLHPELAVLDLVYRPSPTRLVRDAREAGAPACAGAGVLLGQGWRSLEQWLGMLVPESVKDTMATALRADLGPHADV